MKDFTSMFSSVAQAERAILSFAQEVGRASRGCGRLALCYKLSAIQSNFKAIRRYQPPKSTITDHLRDCFGWLTC